MRRTRNELLSLFESGDTPTQDDFRDLIDSTFVLSDIQFYGSQGPILGPVKLYTGQTTVYNAQGHFTVDYRHVGYTQKPFIVPTPVHSVVPTDANFVISATIAAHASGQAAGKAFISGDVTTGEGEHQGPAPVGSVIQFFIIGV